MKKVVEWFHISRALLWIPLTAAIFFIGWQNVVAVTFLYSAYANLESGVASWQGRRAQNETLTAKQVRQIVREELERAREEEQATQ